MNVGSTAFTYDGRAIGPLERLHETAGGRVTTRLQYYGVDLIAEYDAANGLQRCYSHGPGVDNPIVWYEGSWISCSTRRFLIADERGSAVSVAVRWLLVGDAKADIPISATWRNIVHCCPD